MTMEQDPVSQLRDIHIPEPGGFWPPAPGWWILMFVLVALVAVGVVLLRRRRQRNAWRSVAGRDLDRLASRAAVTSQWFSELNGLLKQSALARYPAQHPESMTGAEWVEFLLQTSPQDRVASRPTVQAMVESCYLPTPTCATDDAIRFARLWLGGQKC
jgi:hypothetical protein